MQDKKHDYGSRCRLAPIPGTERQDGVPPAQVQFFYSSTMTIDDPFWAKSSTSSADKKNARGLLRPFSQGDNNMLGRAWMELTSTEDRQRHQDIRIGKLQENEIKAQTADKRQLIINRLVEKHTKRHQRLGRSQSTSASTATNGDNETTPYCCMELLDDVSREIKKHFCSMVRRVDTSLDPEALSQEITDQLAQRQSDRHDHHEHDRKMSLIRPVSQGRIPTFDSPGSTPPQRPRHDIAKPAGRSSWAESDVVSRSRSISQVTYSSSRTQTPVGSLDMRHSAGKDGILGKPFVRVEDPNERRVPTSSSVPTATIKATDKGNAEEAPANLHLSDELTEEERTADDSCEIPTRDSLVTVGASKLHMVVLPDLQMKPIYWSPVNDVAAVIRATWFYRDTMLPVSSAVANQLEAGYQDLRPWSTTWGEEITCALKVGADGEEKVSHDLWPREHKASRQKTRIPKQPIISSDLYCASRCFDGDAAVHGSVEPALEEPTVPSKPFAMYQVVYKDSRHAYLLKPSLQASAYYSRRPVSKIMRGFTVGIPVVRGFDRKAWERLRGAGKSSKPPEEQSNVAESEEEEIESPAVCPACEEEKDRGQITDLVLVAHGIGQKLADRVESFHFTHAINSFRRSVNLDLKNPVVQKVLREDLNGLMILPLNWRMGVSFEDGGPEKEVDDATQADASFALKDIEPETIPAVRSMMSDVMFDIPFYMSHHKGKMITALVSEANRVYRLWCRNNPGFAEKGRVHLIAHSLGSVMTVDILSRQPTRVKLDPLSPQINTQFFEFDTTNLFLAGSPVGFFLLLEKGKLIPRRGRKKLGADAGDSTSQQVGGDAGTFGCLAVDNVYNILAKEDPIAYLLTGAVDPKYAASLKTAYVPSTVSSMLKSMGDAMRQVIPGMAPVSDPFAVEPERPLTARLPSQLELEVHNFTREEIAEKKAFLLNDNGQIDWFLRSGGGPLEIQYLNMLSAHTSYWTNNDFIRLVCLEVGRNPGRANTLPAMRAAKLVKRTPVIATKP